MAVLIEGISVVVRCRAILEKYEDGQAGFVRDVPNGTLCADGELAVVMFMTPADAKGYVERLERRGLRYSDGTKAVDLVVVDQRSGMRAPCDWARLGQSDWDGKKDQPVAVCELVRTVVQKVVVPNGWSYERSLTANGRYVQDGKIPSSLKLLRKEPGVDVFWDEATGRELYVRHPASN